MAFMSRNGGFHAFPWVGFQPRGPKVSFDGSFSKEDLQRWDIIKKLKPPIGGSSSKKGHQPHSASLKGTQTSSDIFPLDAR